MFQFQKKICCAVLLLALAVAGAFAGSASGREASGKDTAVKINGQGYSLAEFNYYFNSWYASFTEENAAYLSYMFDEAKSLKEQEYEDGRTWFDYFTEEAAVSMQQVITLSQKAQEAGISLSREKQKEIGRILETVSEFASGLGMKADDYLAYFYGEGMDETLFTKCLTDARLADAYSQQIKSSIEPSEEEIEAWYKEHSGDYTTVSYERFFARASSMGTEPAAEEKQAAKELAQTVYEQLEAGVPLKEASADHAEEGKYISFDDASYIAGSVYGDWLFDAERTDGDRYLAEDANGWYVMVFHARNEADYLTAHILDAYFPTDETDGSSDEQLEASCLKAEAFREDWEKNGGTSELFRDMAAGLAEDTGAEYEYTDLTRGCLSDRIDRWVFAEDRKAGDCQILYTEEGFHVLYYDGTSRESWKVLAAEDLREEGYQTWFDDVMKEASLVRYEDTLEHAGGY